MNTPNVKTASPQITEYNVQVNWEEIFTNNNKKLLNFIRKRIANREDVEDIVQMTYMEVLRNCHKFAGASRPETWMFGIAVNLIRNYYKNQQERWLKTCNDDYLLEEQPMENDPADITEQLQLLSQTLESIALLPDQTRTMITILVESEGSYQDIASLLNIPIGTVRSRLSRVRETLRDRIYI